MDYSVTVSEPILESGESFKVYLRELPDGIMTYYDTFTTNTFLLEGLNEGDYELGVAFVTDEGVECPMSITIIHVVDEPPCFCGYLENVYVQRNCDQTATLYATFDDSFECATKYILTYTQLGGLSPSTIEYTEKPDTIAIPLTYSTSNVPANISLSIICCDGSTKSCYDMPVSDIRDCTCKSVTTISGAVINFDGTDLKLEFSFSAGDPLPAPPYQVSYTQINTLSPVIATEVVESTDGFKSYPVTVVPHTGNEPIFEIKVTTDCGIAEAEATYLRCGGSFSFNGGEAFPKTIAIYIGGGTGQVNVNYNAQSIPDKFVIREGGLVRASSGYRGNSAYQTMLDSALIARGEPTETIAGSGIGVVYYYSATLMDWVYVDVYAPITNTAWSFNLTCQITYPPS